MRASVPKRNVESSDRAISPDEEMPRMRALGSPSARDSGLSVRVVYVSRGPPSRDAE
jgi:hypothetical protein